MATLYEYYNTGDAHQYGVWGINWYAQTFTPSISHTIRSVKLKLWRSAGLPGDLTVSIRETTDGKPSGEDLCSGTTDGDTLPTSAPGEWREITLGAGVELTADTKYAIVVRCLEGDGSTKYIMWRDDNVNPTYPGDYGSSGDSGVNWGVGTDHDFMFEEWGDPVTPPTVTTQAASDVEATTATGNGNITDNGGEDCDERGIVYDTSSHDDPGNTAPADSEYANYVEETDTFGTGAFTGALTSLEPKTPYYVRAYAHNSAGYSYGDEVSFTTLAAKPTVTTDPATAVGQTTATLNGTLDNDGGEACDCGFEYGETTDYGTETPTESKTSGETFSQPITGLAPNKTYHFRAIATNSAGTVNGADRSLTTDPALVINRAYALAREEL